MLSKGRDRPERVSGLRRWLPVALTLCLGVVLSIVAFLMVRGWEGERMQAELDRRAVGHTTTLQRSIDNYLDIIDFVARFYAASEKVERQEFRDYVKGTLSRLQGIQALVWAPRVSNSNRAAFERATRRDGYANFQVTERNLQGQQIRALARSEYFPVYYVEPYQGNETDLGFDMASSPSRLEALERARDTGTAVAAADGLPGQEAGNLRGFLILRPIYRGGPHRETVAERRENLSGFSVGVFRFRDTVEISLRGMGVGDIDFDLCDQTVPAGERLLYRYESSVPTPATRRPCEEGQGEMHAGSLRGTTLDVAGRQWSLFFHPSPRFLAAQQGAQPWMVLAGGLLLTIILGTYLFTDSARAAVVERLVGDRTAEIVKTNESLEGEIVERKRIEEALGRRTEQMLVIREVTAEITRELDLTTLLGLLTRRAAALLGAKVGAVYLWDERAGVLAAEAWCGFGEGIGDVRLRLGEGIAGTVAHRRKGMVVNDYRTSPYASSFFLERFAFTAVVAEPLLYHDRLIGVLAINNEGTGQCFTEEDGDLLALFAAQAAIAIENARLYAEAQHRAQRIAAVNRLSDIISSSLDLDTVYDAFAKEVKTLISCTRMGIVERDPSGRGLIITQLATDRPTVAGVGSVWSGGEGTGIEWVMSHRRPHIARDLAEERKFVEDEFLLMEGIRSSVRLPLIAKGQVIGAFFLDSVEPARYSERDLDLLVPLGEQLAIAIENAGLHSDLGESKQKIEELYGLSVTMQEQMSLKERLDLILTGAQTVLGFDRINILLLDHERTMLKAVASIGGDEPLERIHVPLGPEGGGIAKAFLERRDIVWEGAGPVPDEWRLIHPYSEIRAFRSKSFVILPLIVRGVAIGVVGADNKLSQKPISVETTRLLKVFAAQAAVAIENARLSEEVAEYAKDLERKVEERTKALKETQVQLIQSGKLAAVGTLAAGVAHELNQPLMVIRGYAQELLADERITDDEIREDLTRIEAQTTRMMAIITHLRDFSRQSKGKREMTDLNRVVTQAFTFLAQQLRARNIEAIQDLDPALPSVWVDPLQIEQVLLNFVTNGRDAMEAAGAGTITVRTERTRDGRVALTITDTGPGIAPDVLDRIFDPFFTTKEIGKGTGLGLSICHGIVEEHRGEILVESPVDDGRGARFTVVFPPVARTSGESDSA